jgi:hypothetical protein
MHTTLRRSLVTVLAVIAAFLSINLGSAQAVQLYGASGSYGSITPYQVQGTTVNTCYPAGNCLTRQLQVPGPTVGKSPSATAAQDIRIQYRVYRWNGSAWALHVSVNKAYSMGYNSAVRLPQMNFNVGTGYYTVQMSLSWHVSSTGMTLGSRGVNYNGNDYACVNSQLACGVSTGWLQFR